MFKKVFKIFVVFTFVTVHFAVGQNKITPRVAGLEKDSVYMMLLTEEYKLKSTEDSLAILVAAKRSQFANDTTNRAFKSNEILLIEAQLFDARSRMGMVTSKTNSIEQEFIIANIGKSAPQSTTPQSTVADTKQRNLLKSRFIKENLTPEEFLLLTGSGDQSKIINKLIAEYEVNYHKIDTLSKLYEEVTTQSESDSVYTDYLNCMAINNRLTDSMENVWGKSINDKIYVYSLLLDKLNKTNILDALNEKQKNIAVNDSHSMSKIFAEYPDRKRILLAYETNIAKTLGMAMAVDSLATEEQKLNEIKLDFRKITVTERDFVDYANLTFNNEPVYSPKNPIPKIEIPDQGKYYSVTIGTFWVHPVFATFKDVSPIYFEKIADGRLRYYAGLFRIYGDAVDAANLLKEHGFKKPDVVMWEDGKFSNIATMTKANEGLFRVEISGISAETLEGVDKVIKKYAGARDIARVGDIFSIGIFSDKIQAEELSKALEITAGISPENIQIVDVK